MLELLIVILLVGWLVGAFAFNAGAFIHLLLVVALVVLVVRLMSGRRVV
jgi:hypothetical protein